MEIPWGGDRVTRVSETLAETFRSGDSLIVMQHTGELLHVPQDAATRAREAVSAAVDAFDRMGDVSDDQITRFYIAFAAALEDDGRFEPIAAANASDVEAARERGRSVTRLILDDTMRSDMVAGLKGWADAPSGRGRVVDEITHGRWRLEQVVDGLGVVGFVFEGKTERVRRRNRRPARRQYGGLPHRIGCPRHCRGHRRACPRAGTCLERAPRRGSFVGGEPIESIRLGNDG